MDFLDPVKERRSRQRLLLGYCLVALAICGATVVLLYQAFGYGLDKQGKITQNGLVFVSSQPSNAQIYLNNVLYKSNTNTRVVVPADTYNLKVQLTGYRDWQRQIVVNGGDVQHFDYPFLFPTTLQTSKITDLSVSPSMTTQSPDHRWLLLGKSDEAGSFSMYDLKSPDKPQSSTVTLPDGSFTAGDSTGAQSWTAVEWAADNRHVLLEHTFTTKGTASTEYILLDRETPVSSVNLTNSLHLAQGDTLNMFNNRVAQFYVFNPSTFILQRVNASDASVVSTLTHVLAFKPYSDNKVLYISDQSPTGKALNNQVVAVLQDGQQTIALRALPAGASTYALNLAQYSGDWYIAVGANNDTAAYVYKNPQDQKTTSNDVYPAPWRRLPVANPSYLSFSTNTQLLLAENGQDFAVYDAENALLYRYHTDEPIDQPQLHATWMDGDRLMYVSGGTLRVFDYDDQNPQTLLTANAVYRPVFSANYKFLYTLGTPLTDGKVPLSSTSLTLQ